jgi:hypothetical protein
MGTTILSHHQKQIAKTHRKPIKQSDLLYRRNKCDDAALPLGAVAAAFIAPVGS